MKWSKEEISEFDSLVEAASSPSQMERLRSRLDMPKFIAAHGKEKCYAMFAHLESGGKKEDSP